MADPATMLIVALGAQAAGQVVQGVQGYQAGKAAKQDAQNQAASEMASGLFAEQQARAEAGRNRAAMLARLSGSGVTTAATPGNVIDETTRANEVDALAERFSGQSRSRAYTAQGRIDDAQGKTALISGLTGAAKSGYDAYGAYEKLQPSGKKTTLLGAR